MNAILLANFGITLAQAALYGVTLLAFMVIYSVGMSLMRRDYASKRVKALRQRQEELRQEAKGRKKRKRAAPSEKQPANWMRLLVKKLKLIKENQSETIQQKLFNAGYRSKDAIIVYGFLQLVSPLVVLAMALLVMDVDFSNLYAIPSWQLFMIPFSGYVGLKLPGILVANKRQKRDLKVRRSIPDTLDLMMICAEAGLSLGATLSRVARELGMAYPMMADELSLTSIEMGLLPDRKQALKNFAWRNDLEEIRGIVNVLLQTEKYGTPIAQALRVLSAEFRTQRMLAAEQKAARLPAIMTVPMILFILPTLFVVIITPAILQIYKT